MPQLCLCWTFLAFWLEKKCVSNDFISSGGSAEKKNSSCHQELKQKPFHCHLYTSHNNLTERKQEIIEIRDSGHFFLEGEKKSTWKSPTVLIDTGVSQQKGQATNIAFTLYWSSVLIIDNKKFVSQSVFSWCWISSPSRNKTAGNFIVLNMALFPIFTFLKTKN